ncbi:MAG: right-handed parallel beta-helix repeat-containing protein [Clostridia bacterium]|nr:right-handed parallel beta-helix repeat-containing protein [Clostridia bacterium]
MIYYVSVNGSNLNDGSINLPFKTINHASKIAVAGDTIRVFGGTYREWVDPKNGGTSNNNRITYEAVQGEHPVIKGSEVITGWKNIGDTVWTKTISNSLFGDWNPFAIMVEGDWLVDPIKEYRVHLGDVYINGVSMFEAKSISDLYDSTLRTIGAQHYRRIEDELILNPELTRYKWYAEVDDTTTTLYCNFHEYNPNIELIEINVRPCCFYPKLTGVNYITLRGFEIAHAGCPWTPPTADQIGMVGPHWSKGWIIENNDIHDAKCSAISLGKEIRTGHNTSSRFHRKSGHRYQLEAVFSALKMGWNKDSVGSHIVRNNAIHDCGQNGIVGHLGCIFSKIEHNNVYNIGVKHEFWGHEIAGIKFHSAIDTHIINNNIHDCTLGMWLDWEAQGMRVTRNVFHKNNRDFMIEVSHGPILIDHNVFTSQYSIDNWSQGSAFVHNLILGKIFNRTILERSTPYHQAHSTNVAGYCEIYGGDDRYYNNIFAGKWENNCEFLEQFSTNCDRFTSPEEYNEKINKIYDECGHIGYKLIVEQPVWLKDNAYSGYARPSKHDKNAFIAKGLLAEINEDNGNVFLSLNVPKEVAYANCERISTKRLGETRISALPFDAPNGDDYDFSFDLINESYGDNVKPGPLASLNEGYQEVLVWKK